MKLVSLCLTLLFGLAPLLQGRSAVGPQAETPSSAHFERGVLAYRAGAFAEAEAHWEACLHETLDSAARGRVAYNLGNACHRQGEELRAVGWYTVALEHRPRDPELWENLEFVRAAAGLEAADSGDLSATLRRLLNSFLPSEARSLFALGLALLLFGCLGEALRGGRLWNRTIWIGLLLCGLLALPWIGHQRSLERDPILIVGKPSVALRSEPRPSLPSIGKLMAGQVAQRIDALPGWVRVEDEDGQRGWIQETAIFELRH